MMHVVLTCLMAIISVCAVGCGNVQPVSVAADYGDFFFSRWSDESEYDLFGLSIEGSNRKPPSIEIMLPNGKIFNCDSITVEIAKDYFPYKMEFDDPKFDEQLKQKIHVHRVYFDIDKKDSLSLVFTEGKFESVTVRPDGKFRFADQKEFVSFPLSERKMKGLFGPPKRYKKVYPTHP